MTAIAPGTGFAKGQVIGKLSNRLLMTNSSIYHGSMLHLEMSSGQARGPLTQAGEKRVGNASFNRRRDLIDPTSILLAMSNDSRLRLLVLKSQLHLKLKESTSIQLKKADLISQPQFFLSLATIFNRCCDDLAIQIRC